MKVIKVIYPTKWNCQEAGSPLQSSYNGYLDSSVSFLLEDDRFQGNILECFVESTYCCELRIQKWFKSRSFSLVLNLSFIFGDDIVICIFRWTFLYAAELWLGRFFDLYHEHQYRASVIGNSCDHCVNFMVIQGDLNKSSGACMFWSSLLPI